MWGNGLLRVLWEIARLLKTLCENESMDFRLLKDIQNRLDTMFCWIVVTGGIAAATLLFQFLQLLLLLSK